MSKSISGSTQPRIKCVLGSFPRLQRPGHDVNHPPAPSAGVKKEWSYNYTPPVCLRCVEREIFTLASWKWKIVFLVSISSGHVIGYSSEFSVQIIIRQTFEAVCTEIQLCVAFYRAKVTVKHTAENLLQPVARLSKPAAREGFRTHLCSIIRITHSCWVSWWSCHVLFNAINNI
jgi:hypothetical protein